MSTRPNTDDYLRLFLQDVPMMDVRAPVEYQQGAFPYTKNLPLMIDQERHEVGICYKQQGQEAAIALGHKLVQGEIKASRVAAWKAFAKQHPEGYLYCFRGGLRSRVTQQWLKEVGIDYPYVKGGYKAMRRFLIDELEVSLCQREFVILGGRTGTGKTKVIKRVPQSLDLEGLANHRGSSFGRRVTPQPKQIDFENQVSIALLKHRQATPGLLMLEDEGRMIGSCHLPPSLYEQMGRSPLVLVEESMDSRVDCVFEDYVEGLLGEHQELYGDEGGERYRDYMLNSLDRIRKRLGGVDHQRVRSLMEEAMRAHLEQDDVTVHRAWIVALLRDYYDPMYDYQLSKKSDRIRFRGTRDEIIDWFSSCQLKGIR